MTGSRQGPFGKQDRAGQEVTGMSADITPG